MHPKTPEMTVLGSQGHLACFHAASTPRQGQGPGGPPLHPRSCLFLELPLWSRRWNLAPGYRCLSSSSRNQQPSHRLCLANSHLHLQVRPHPTSRVVLQAEQLPSPGQQQQVAHIQMPSSAPAGPAPGCRYPPPPATPTTAARTAVGKTTRTQGGQ